MVDMTEKMALKIFRIAVRARLQREKRSPLEALDLVLQIVKAAKDQPDPRKFGVAEILALTKLVDDDSVPWEHIIYPQKPR